MLYGYIARAYLRYFLLILCSLEFFYLFIDFLQHTKELPDAANIVVLYLSYQAVAALKITLPLSLVLGFVSLCVFLVRSNAMVAMFSFGISKRNILASPFLISVAATFIYLLLESTQIGYFYDNAQHILKNERVARGAQDIFIKHGNSFVYFQTLHPDKMAADDIKIYEMKGEHLKSVTVARKANFVDGSWNLARFDKTTFPDTVKLGGEGVAAFSGQNGKVLEGFEPKIISSIVVGRENLNIVDTFKALRLFEADNINLSKLEGSLLSSLLMPFFAPCFIVLIFAFTPAYSRLFDISLFLVSAVFSTLITWGVLQTFAKFSSSGSSSRGLILAPMALLLAAAIYVYRRRLVA